MVLIEYLSYTSEVITINYIIHYNTLLYLDNIIILYYL